MKLKQEVWHQDSVETSLWMGENGLLLNTAALEERTFYFEVVRIPAQTLSTSGHEPEGKHTPIGYT